MSQAPPCHRPAKKREPPPQRGGRADPAPTILPAGGGDGGGGGSGGGLILCMGTRQGRAGRPDELCAGGRKQGPAGSRAGKNSVSFFRPAAHGRQLSRAARGGEQPLHGDEGPPAQVTYCSVPVAPNGEGAFFAQVGPGASGASQRGRLRSARWGLGETARRAQKSRGRDASRRRRVGVASLAGYFLLTNPLVKNLK